MPGLCDSGPYHGNDIGWRRLQTNKSMASCSCLILLFLSVAFKTPDFLPGKFSSRGLGPAVCFRLSSGRAGSTLFLLCFHLFSSSCQHTDLGLVLGPLGLVLAAPPLHTQGINSLFKWCGPNPPPPALTFQVQFQTLFSICFLLSPHTAFISKVLKGNPLPSTQTCPCARAHGSQLDLSASSGLLGPWSISH